MNGDLIEVLKNQSKAIDYLIKTVDQLTTRLVRLEQRVAQKEMYEQEQNERRA